MSQQALQEFTENIAKKFHIPGASVGVWAGGREHYAHFGVTSVDNPLSVNKDTLFILGSVTKTFTATTLMRLVADGKVKLDALVKDYVPELKLKDQQAADKITIQHLLNHTSGLDWGVIADTGEGDDALANYVAMIANLEQIAEPGARASYSQAGFNLLGRVIEKVTGKTFEHAVADTLFTPLSLSNSFFARDDIMTRRFSAGHNRDESGDLTIARLWRRARGDNPGGGVTASISDLLHWAMFHLGDGKAPDGSVVLPKNILQQMQKPTTELRASNFGDAIGLCWFLREVDGTRAIGHAGSANGQFAEMLIIPERNFAVVAMANEGPDGIPFNQAAVRWALEHYEKLIDRDPEPIAFDADYAKDITGNYMNDVMTLDIRTTDNGLQLEVLMKPEIRAAADKELPPDHAPFDFGILSGGKDEYIITNGAFKGQRGFFTRNDTGKVTGIDLAGRLFGRINN